VRIKITQSMCKPACASMAKPRGITWERAEPRPVRAGSRMCAHAVTASLAQGNFPTARRKTLCNPSGRPHVGMLPCSVRGMVRCRQGWSYASRAAGMQAGWKRLKGVVTSLSSSGTIDIAVVGLSLNFAALTRLE
jgi:hypothetical protein